MQRNRRPRCGIGIGEGSLGEFCADAGDGDGVIEP